MEFRRAPDTDGMEAFDAIIADMLPRYFSDSIEETVSRVKEEYFNFRNDGMRAARLLTEKTLFRLYELKYFFILARSQLGKKRITLHSNCTQNYKNYKYG